MLAPTRTPRFPITLASMGVLCVVDIRPTDRTYNTIALARRVADDRGAAEIASRDILYGLAMEGSGIAANVLRRLGVHLADPLPISWTNELAHAELVARVGYRAQRSLPRWFDEGLAVQVDERVSDTAWLGGMQGGGSMPDLEDLVFIRADGWDDYSVAKYEVGLWLQEVGPDGLLEFLDTIRAGTSFDALYSK